MEHRIVLIWPRPLDMETKYKQLSDQLTVLHSESDVDSNGNDHTENNDEIPLSQVAK